jgi:hypothetical protein
VLSFPAAADRTPAAGTASPAAAPTAAQGGAAAALHAVLASAEALVVQGVAASAAEILAAGEQLDWAPDEPPRSTAYSPHIDELIMHLKVSAGPSETAALSRVVRLKEYTSVWEACLLELLPHVPRPVVRSHPAV